MNNSRDAVIGRVRQALRPVLGRGRLVLIPPFNDGSLGDQAMTDAAARILSRDLGFQVQLLHIVPTPTPVRLRTACLHTDVGRAAQRSPLAALGDTLIEAGAVTLGADVVDGAYSVKNELNRLALLKRKMAQSKVAAVLGCSFSERPAPEVLREIRATPELPYFLRDPVSLARFEAAAGRPGRLVADVAFLLEPEIASAPARAARDWIAARRAEGRSVLAVNFSGHGFIDLPDGAIDACAQALNLWLGRGPERAALFVPHDFQPAPFGDEEPLSMLAARLRPIWGERVALVGKGIDAWEAKALMGEVTAAVTGRMHLAVAALGMGKPTLNVVRMGKFEGLMKHFGLENSDLTLPADAVRHPETVAARIEALMAQAPALSARVKARLPDIMALSRQNFDWLAPVPAGGAR